MKNLLITSGGISVVNVNGKDYRATGQADATAIINEDGSIKTDAAPLGRR